MCFQVFSWSEHCRFNFDRFLLYCGMNHLATMERNSACEALQQGASLDRRSTAPYAEWWWSSRRGSVAGACTFYSSSVMMHCIDMLASPISTYGGKATTKSGLDPSTHAIVYMRSEKPGRLQAETGLTKTPLVVDPARHDQKLDVRSRINFAKIYTVEHNVKVMEVGHIGKESLHLLETYWRNQMQPDPE